MLETERTGIEQIRQQIDDGQAQKALLALKKLRPQLSEEFMSREFWRIDELYGASFQILGDMEGAVQAYWQAGQHDRFLRSQMEHFSSYLFALHYLPGLSDDELAAQHFLYERFFAGRESFSHAKREHSRLRIGYLSPDFREHAVGRCILPLLQERDAEHFAVYGYRMNRQEDEAWRTMQPMADVWRDFTEVPVELAAQQIYEDGIDILVDLAGHSDGGRTLMIAGVRPAPVQLSGIGWFDTTGLSAIDYFLTDALCDPPGQNEELFREKLLRAARVPFCYTPLAAMPEPGPVHASCVFGCFNNFAKITDDMLRLWLQIVRGVPGSRLILKDTTGFAERLAGLRERAARIGFTAAQLELRTGSVNYLQEYREIDIALDPYPYPGGITTCDALYMGVPVVTLAGRRHGTRLGLSILTSLGLEGLAAMNAEQYKACATALAQDGKRLKNLKANLRQLMQVSPLMDAKNYMRSLETAYQKIWQEWLQS